MKRNLALILAVAMLTTPSVAQMGGGMDMGGAASGNGTGYDPLKMSKAEEKSWAVCQAAPADDMAKDKKCVRLKKKADRIAVRGR